MWKIVLTPLEETPKSNFWMVKFSNIFFFFNLHLCLNTRYSKVIPNHSSISFNYNTTNTQTFYKNCGICPGMSIITIILNCGTSWRCGISLKSQPFYPWVKSHRFRLNRRLDAPQSLSELTYYTFEESILVLWPSEIAVHSSSWPLFPELKQKIAKLTGQHHLVPKIRKPEATVSLPVACLKRVAYLSSGQFFILSMVNFKNLCKGLNYIRLHHWRPPCKTPPALSGKASIWRHTLCSCY